MEPVIGICTCYAMPSTDMWGVVLLQRDVRYAALRSHGEEDHHAVPSPSEACGLLEACRGSHVGCVDGNRRIIVHEDGLSAQIRCRVTPGLLTLTFSRLLVFQSHAPRRRRHAATSRYQPSYQPSCSLRDLRF